MACAPIRISQSLLSLIPKLAFAARQPTHDFADGFRSPADAEMLIS